jgi:hypothetical protein
MMSRAPGSIPGRLATWTLPLAAGLLLAGCQTATYNYDLEIDSVAAVGQRWGPTYEVRPLPGSPADTDPFFGGVATIIGEELEGKGLIPVVPGKEPDLIVLVDYGIRPPKIEYRVVTVPTAMGMGVVGIDPVTGAPIRSRPMGAATGGGGFTEEVQPVTIFEKYMILSAVEGKIDPERGSRKELANVEVVSGDQRPELEPYLPVLAMATGRQLGAPTSEVEEVTVRADR